LVIVILPLTHLSTTALSDVPGLPIEVLSIRIFDRPVPVVVPGVNIKSPALALVLPEALPPLLIVKLLPLPEVFLSTSNVLADVPPIPIEPVGLVVNNPILPVVESNNNGFPDELFIVPPGINVVVVILFTNIFVKNYKVFVKNCEDISVNI
jgi:hypothetical protein